MKKLKIAVIGARRNRQGIGQYVARDLDALGATVTAIVGTTPNSVEAARQTLKEEYSIEARGYTDVEAMFRTESLDAVAICSPHEHHVEHLEVALKHNLHVLCEKPLVFAGERDNAAVANQLIERFASASRLLMVNKQWPYTLPAFHAMFPVTRGAPLLRFEMLLAPAEDGIGMIPNALPHVFSMLSALGAKRGRAEDIRIDRTAPGQLNVEFTFFHSNGLVTVKVILITRPDQPRPAGYAINDCTVLRTIELPAYRMHLLRKNASLCELLDRKTPAADGVGNGENRVSLEDPLRLLLADFIRRLGESAIPASPDPELAGCVANVDRIYRMAAMQFDP